MGNTHHLIINTHTYTDAYCKRVIPLQFHLLLYEECLELLFLRFPLSRDGFEEVPGSYGFHLFSLNLLSQLIHHSNETAHQALELSDLYRREIAIASFIAQHTFFQKCGVVVAWEAYCQRSPCILLSTRPWSEPCRAPTLVSWTVRRRNSPGEVAWGPPFFSVYRALRFRRCHDTQITRSSPSSERGVCAWVLNRRL